MLSFEGQVQGGRFSPDMPDSFKEGVAAFEGKFVLVTIDRLKNTRSTQQNKFLWAIYTMIASETGHTSEEIHEYCKMKFLPREFELVNKKNGETDTITIPKSTAKLDTLAMADYLTQVMSLAAELGIIINDNAPV